MARCWTCGSKVTGFSFTCSVCKNSRELQAVQDVIGESQREISEQVSNLEHSLQRRFDELSDTISTGFSVMASVMVWGFQEATWRLEQQTRILRNIDQTLVSIDKSERYRRRTEANELREQADELRWKGVLDKSEELYLKALELNPLDYEIYVGLAETYLKINQFDKAESALEKSLPHAPMKQDLNYKSHSLRLIGKIYACGEDFERATKTLKQAVELSPTWPDAHYDYAQYCAQTADNQQCLSSLEKAVTSQPLFWSLAKHERNFDSVRAEVERVLSRVQTETFRPMDEIMREVTSVYELTCQLITLCELRKLAPTLENDMQRVDLLYRMRNVSRLNELIDGFLWLLSRLKEATEKRLAVQAELGSRFRDELTKLEERFPENERVLMVVCIGLFVVLAGLCWFVLSWLVGYLIPEAFIDSVNFLAFVVAAVASLVTAGWLAYGWHSGLREEVRQAKSRIVSFEKNHILPLRKLLEALASMGSQLQAKQKH